jgi:anhydro-N-acetylmuramic acid kinase
MAELYIGLMSGTSLDGVDGVLASISAEQTTVLQHAHQPFNTALASELLSLNSTGPDELHRAALAANALSRVYADVVQRLLRQSGVAASSVTAIGAHGQTVRHRPGEFDGNGYTLQIQNPALLAELTGISVVADFRSRDVAAGGQGAPLVPAFHQALFARPGKTVAVLNIGGISNLSILQDGAVLGFDCGPGNALMDAWCQQHTGQRFDQGGAWAASGQVHLPLLERLLQEPFLERSPPKSTGRDLFNATWLAQKLVAFPTLAPLDVQTTLTEFTARVCANALLRHTTDCESLIVCGGGALNLELMRRLQALLPSLKLVSSETAGLPPLQVEATAFAWLARKAISRQPLDFRSITGARGARILGCIYPA